MNLRQLLSIAVLTSALASTTLYMGCKIDSADSVIRNVRINVGGLYTAGSSSRIISQHSGAAITQLNIIQDGDRLQAIDNHGLIFRGTIGNSTGGGAGATSSDSSATFTLKGQTTAGAEGIISGSFTVSGSTSTMRGTWAEPSTFGNVFATAQNVEQPPSGGTNTPGTNTQVIITP